LPGTLQLKPEALRTDTGGNDVERRYPDQKLLSTPDLMTRLLQGRINRVKPEAPQIIPEKFLIHFGARFRSQIAEA